MRLIKATDKLNNTVITLGKFDGNHIGHRSLFSEAMRIKKESTEDLSTVIFTFDINPGELTLGTDSGNLYTSAERMEIEEAEGIDYVLIWPFTKETMNKSPEEFVREVLAERLGVRYVVVGEDFRFGKNRSGDVAALAELGEKYGFQVKALPKVMYKGQEVSSSRIKEAILAGNLKEANFMLGSPFTVTGVVKSGKHLGRKLGFPTINFIAPEGKILPPDGVYATKTYVDGKPYISISNVGVRPTFVDGNVRTIETNIFDFDNDIYGENVRVEFYSFIRPERKFKDVSELMDEIEKNKLQVKDFFKTKNGKQQ